ncbi:MAG: hypothetical protein ONB11_11305, partial [candidate division KSB1 bacterium]|nr:hypothetical protein [candidate division KSB1 bacterium]MDZ7340889.1 hypothetical protein [candidate division KSB1 bacterium]
MMQPVTYETIDPDRRTLRRVSWIYLKILWMRIQLGYYFYKMVFRQRLLRLMGRSRIVTLETRPMKYSLFI